MAEPFLGEIRLMSFVVIPPGWAPCNGQFLPINQNQALFALLGTNYGGNGQTTFALPDLRGRAPVHVGNGTSIGEAGGKATHTLTLSETPGHTHTVDVSNALATLASPSGAALGKKGRLGRDLYAAPNNLVSTNPQCTTSVGGSQPHENRQPYSVLQACIALTGIFPSRN
jgi:microcystin-dependent protein